MVLVEDVTADSSNASNGQPNGQQNSNKPSSTSNTPNNPTLKDFILRDKVSFALWCTRIFSIICTFLFIFPVSSYDQFTIYQKALMASAATSALKLHQRLTGVPFQLNREYFQKLVVEDSFHYLLYSIIFLNSYPITIVLVPVLLFAILHVASYTKAMINVMSSSNSLGFIRNATNFIISKDKDIMRFAAMNEILLMPCVIIMIFSGKGGIFIPFVYYRFLCLRYQSRRNPYNKRMFTELRCAIEYYTNQPKCPVLIRNVTQRLIAFVSRLAPQ